MRVVFFFYTISHMISVDDQQVWFPDTADERWNSSARATKSRPCKSFIQQFNPHSYFNFNRLRRCILVSDLLIICANLCIAIVDDRKVISGMIDTNAYGVGKNAPLERIATECIGTNLNAHRWAFALEAITRDEIWLEGRRSASSGRTAVGQVGGAWTRTGCDGVAFKRKSYIIPQCADVQTVPGTYDIIVVTSSVAFSTTPAVLRRRDPGILRPFPCFSPDTFELDVGWFPWTLNTQLSR